jgi:hypothetical protein
MSWFGIRKLERQLADGTLTDKQAFYYLIYAYIFLTLPQLIPHHTYQDKRLLISQWVISVGMLIFTLNKTFRLNAEGKGGDYFKRLWCVCVVIGNKLLLFTLIALIPLSLIMYLTGFNKLEPYQKDLINATIVLALQAANLLLAIRSFQRLKELDLGKGQNASAN